MAIMDIEQPALFDYSALDSDTRTFVEDKAQSIHARLKRTAEDIIAIGLDLIGVKAKLPDMKFSAWLRAEFEMTRSMAYNFINTAKRFPNGCPKFGQVSMSVLYELAAPSTPETVIHMVETGQIPATLPAIREAKQGTQQSIPANEFLDEIFPGFQQFTEEQLDSPAPVQSETEQRNAHVMKIMGSSESPEWYTPQEVISLVIECLGEVDVDPCSNSHEQPAVPARTLYTRDDDGLAHPWIGKIYLNPPYGTEIPAWIQKLVQEYEESGNVQEAIALLPARIDTQWFQPLYAYPMCHIRGRLQFENAQNSAPFPSILVYLGRRPEKFIEVFKGLGPIMRRIG